MIKVDKDAVICDFAETYHIYNIWELPLKYVATLACGLGNNSRIAQKIAGSKFRFNEMLLAAIADRLTIMIWSQTEDARKGKKPKLLLDDEANEIQGFDSADAFERMRQRLLKGD